jgi:hypothetical protein
MKDLSGIIGSIVRLLTKACPDWRSRVEGNAIGKSHIRPDKEFIRVLVRKTRIGLEES